MRILLAIDGSASSRAVLRLVGSLAWPEGTIIELVGVVQPAVQALLPSGMAFPMDEDARTTETGRALAQTLEAAADELEAPGRGVRPVLLEGRAANVIVERAAQRRAELVVIGSRGLGPLRSMLLGSVSAEVVDHAPCPVLVVRRPAVGPILLAVDGSRSSNGAVTFLAGARFLASRPIEVVSVAPSDASPLMSLVPLSDAELQASPADLLVLRQRSEGIAARATEELLAEGWTARWSVSQGHPAREIIQAATLFGSDLIVVGSRGRTGVTRMMLGSVARNVLLHTDASVLIVREPVRSKAPRRVAEPVTVATGAARAPERAPAPSLP
jgi:nucleotide-binding universal stress UspA family protein